MRERDHSRLRERDRVLLGARAPARVTRAGAQKRGDVRDGSKGHPAEVQAGDDVDQDAVEPAIGRLPGADRSKVGDDERCEEQDDADHGRPDREELHAR